jgi:hypothetical protein
LPFDPVDKRGWDAAIRKADQEYAEKIHCMVCGSDCHSHVARVLDIVKQSGCACHNKVELAVKMFFCGRHIGMCGVISTWLGFIIFAVVMVALKA